MRPGGAIFREHYAAEQTRLGSRHPVSLRGRQVRRVEIGPDGSPAYVASKTRDSACSSLATVPQVSATRGRNQCVNRSARSLRSRRNLSGQARTFRQREELAKGRKNIADQRRRSHDRGRGASPVRRTGRIRNATNHLDATFRARRCRSRKRERADKPRLGNTFCCSVASGGRDARAGNCDGAGCGGEDCQFSAVVRSIREGVGGATKSCVARFAAALTSPRRPVYG